MKRVVVSILSLLTFIGLAAFVYVLTKPSPTPSAGSYIPVSAPVAVEPPNLQELLSLTNTERAKNGLRPLALEVLLNKSAQLKAEDMTKNDYFAHVHPTTGKTGNSYIWDVGTTCAHTSENIVQNFEDDNSSRGAVDAWMNSAPHRKTMLRQDFETVGFGISGQNIVAHFCDKG